MCATRFALSLCLALFVGAANAESFPSWKYRQLDDAAKSKGARCLDGSAPGYYIEKGAEAKVRMTRAVRVLCAERRCPLACRARVDQCLMRLPLAPTTIYYSLHPFPWLRLNL